MMQRLVQLALDLFDPPGPQDVHEPVRAHAEPPRGSEPPCPSEPSR